MTPDIDQPLNRPIHGQPGAEMPTGHEQEGLPEALKPAHDLYTVEGGELIINFKEAIDSGDFTDIRHTTEEGLAFTEGLYFGMDAENYDLNDKRTQVDLMNMFISTDASMDRPSATNVLLALRDGLTRTVRVAKQYERNPEGWRQKEIRRRKSYWEGVSRNSLLSRGEIIPAETIAGLVAQEVAGEEAKLEAWGRRSNELHALKDHLDARLMMERAFQDRQKTCEDDEGAAGLLKNGASPEKGHWIAYYQGNKENPTENRSKWGHAVDSVERTIIDIALGKVRVPGMNAVDSRNIYANGFKTTGQFISWLKVLLDKSEIDGRKRMDVVWNAWKMSMIKEEVTRVAWYVKSKGEYEFGTPPLVSSLAQKLAHNEKVRAKEYGLKGSDASGNVIDLDENGVNRNPQRLPDSIPAISHAGHPLSFGRFGRLCDSFMRQTKIKMPVSGGEQETTLFEIWYNKNMSQADNNFPWANTEIRSANEPAGEPSAGSFGGWLLRRSRGHTIRSKYITQLGPEKGFSESWFTSGDMRSMVKLGLIRPGNLKWVDPQKRDAAEPDNPFAYLLGSYLLYSKMPMSGTVPGEGNNWYTSGEIALVYPGIAGKIPLSEKTGLNPSFLSHSDILNTAYYAKIISLAEIHWIKQILLRNTPMKDFLKSLK